MTLARLPMLSTCPRYRWSMFSPLIPRLSPPTGMPSGLARLVGCPGSRYGTLSSLSPSLNQSLPPPRAITRDRLPTPPCATSGSGTGYNDFLPALSIVIVIGDHSCRQLTRQSLNGGELWITSFFRHSTNGANSFVLTTSNPISQKGRRSLRVGEVITFLFDATGTGRGRRLLP